MQTIPEHIFHWAKQTPYSTAVIHDGQRLSYRSFARLIAKARGFFARQGFSGPGHAAVAVHNLRDFWIVSLALRSLGLTTLAARSAEAVQHLRLPELRLVATLAAEAWPGLEGVCATRALPLLSALPDGETSLPLDAPGTRHPPGGHIVWTSGTTGTERMVLLGPDIHALLLPLIVDVTGMNRDTVLCLFGISGATSVGYRWSACPWLVGGATLFEQKAERYQALLHPRLTHAFLNPAMLASILAAPADGFPRSDTMRLCVGGGPITQMQVDQARARITPHVSNYLASTEAGPIALTPLETAEDRRWHRLLPSRPVELVDESGHPTPLGEAGLVRIGTAGGPTSYLGDEQATRLFFRDGYFYPGDQAVMRADGRIALQGRITDVINVLGKKVSPAPAEERLADILDASGVCLFSIPDDDGGEELHIVLETRAPFEPEPLRQVLKEIRGFNMAIVHVMPQMPRNQMGKIVRREVRAQSRTIPGHIIQW